MENFIVRAAANDSSAILAFISACSGGLKQIKGHLNGQIKGYSGPDFKGRIYMCGPIEKSRLVKLNIFNLYTLSLFF